MIKFGKARIMDAFFAVKDFATDTAVNLKETVEMMVDGAKLQYRITAQRKELTALYAALGKNLYRGAARGEGDNEDTDFDGEEEVSSIYERITAKEDLLNGLEKQLRVVCGRQICANCGRFTSDRYRYCPFCGRVLNDHGDLDTEADVTSEELDLVREIDDI